MITLSDYLSFIFGEVTRARQHADAISIEIAKSYAKDDLLKHFSIPRFKIPELELKVPILISDINYDNEYLFKVSQEQFLNKFTTEFQLAFNTLIMIRELVFDDRVRKELLILHETLVSSISGKNLNSYNELIKIVKLNVQQNLEKIITSVLTINKRLEEYQKQFPKKEHYIDLINSINKFVLFNIKLSRSSLTNLLINPETSIINESATDISVFEIKAKITEEGIFINSIKDENGKEVFTVNFE